MGYAMFQGGPAHRGNPFKKSAMKDVLSF